jgi:hypothetical protein
MPDMPKRAWQKVAALAAKEQNATELAALIKELLHALDDELDPVKKSAAFAALAKLKL